MSAEDSITFILKQYNALSPDDSAFGHIVSLPQPLKSADLVKQVCKLLKINADTELTLVCSLEHWDTLIYVDDHTLSLLKDKQTIYYLFKNNKSPNNLPQIRASCLVVIL